MNDPAKKPKTQSGAVGSPPRPPRVTARGLQGDDDSHEEISPELILVNLIAVGWLTNDEVASVRADPTVTARRALELLIEHGMITKSHIEKIQLALANTEYHPLTGRT